ncbi:beta-ketoacyl-ACP reductase [Desulfosarcina ovata subsp. sediminis]|uniref:Beta-ketoacyl-ACP reductase n=1 Tax=Desulfosarcina ovata subsp. sediminis TaxID=885957 RepID=A0A5K8A0W6_9BACT|nr:SDR family NAD(P)-dependent oxidoreductase [Desulfosarcina ovata]BBO86008.1 beta-ketoacyl-ACP reductase [Desulfosarcina ovata subsp. sediminis]
MEEVKNRVAVVTGATDEIGSAICRRLAGKGAIVVAVDTDQQKVDALVAELTQTNAQAMGAAIDPTDETQIRAMIADVTAKAGMIEILVNNFDYCDEKPLEEVSNEGWQMAFDRNLDPVFFMTREILPGMRARKYGRVINIGNLSYIGLPGLSSYAAAKSAIFGLTRTLALESAKDGVTVNCVAKGDIAETDMTEETIAERIKSIPVRRIGKPEDVAKAVGFFASDRSPYVTGQTFFACGGKSIHFSMSI